jgi:hypothetical protein
MKKLLLFCTLFFVNIKSYRFDFTHVDFEKNEEIFGTDYDFSGIDSRELATTMQVENLTYKALPKEKVDQEPRSFLSYCMLVAIAAFVFDSCSFYTVDGKVVYHCKPLSTALKWCSNATWLWGL